MDPGPEFFVHDHFDSRAFDLLADERLADFVHFERAGLLDRSRLKGCGKGLKRLHRAFSIGAQCIHKTKLTL